MPTTMNVRRGSEYNAFLFAPIGDEPTGLKLSVLSALARQNIDPWQEAATLARLSTSAARTRLAGEITSALGRENDPNMVAANLIALLPRTVQIVPPTSDLATRLRGLGSNAHGHSASMNIKDIIVMILVMAGLTIGMNYVMTHKIPNHSPPTTSHPHTPTAPK
ncbi:hypothetical protein [Acidiphilium sp.]|uniref:hypothetical protein n=1 Tax=Acidiphilium sp. TaxID=527 RepID=UPI003D02263D